MRLIFPDGQIHDHHGLLHHLALTPMQTTEQNCTSHFFHRGPILLRQHSGMFLLRRGTVPCTVVNFTGSLTGTRPQWSTSQIQCCPEQHCVQPRPAFFCVTVMHQRSEHFGDAHFASSSLSSSSVFCLFVYILISDPYSMPSHICPLDKTLLIHCCNFFLTLSPMSKCHNSHFGSLLYL